MPQFVVIGLGILFLLQEFGKGAKGLFKNLFSSTESKVLGIGVVAYILYNRFNKVEQKETVLIEAANDTTTQDAMALHSALHPLFPTPVFGVYVPDGTDEAAALAIARKQAGNFANLATRYKLIYNLDLATELQSEGIYNEFMAAINTKPATTTPTQTGTTPPVYNAAPVVFVNSIYGVRGNYRCRNVDTYAQERLTAAGEKFRVKELKHTTIAGTAGWWVKAESTALIFTTPPVFWIYGDAFK